MKFHRPIEQDLHQGLDNKEAWKHLVTILFLITVINIAHVDYRKFWIISENKFELVYLETLLLHRSVGETAIELF